jgi:hypothetical protein
MAVAPTRRAASAAPTASRSGVSTARISRAGRCWYRAAASVRRIAASPCRLTLHGSSHSLVSVRRTLASLLVAALVAAPGVLSSLHVHEYTDHDHETHHHGPASHEHGHEPSPLNAPDLDHLPVFDGHSAATARAESCDPGRHVVAVKMSCGQLPRLHLHFAELPGPDVAVPAAPVRSAVGMTDVRVHGPPFDPRVPSRAPPLTAHA